MPLMLSSSDKALLHRITKEIKAGRPRKQAAAIAYATQRRAGSDKYFKGERKREKKGMIR